MKIVLSAARLLHELMTSQTVNYGSFQGRSRALLKQLIDDGVLEVTPVGTQQKKVTCLNVANLLNYLHHKFEIPDLETYITFLENEDSKRSDAVKAASNSKHRKVKVFSGFLVNTYDAIECSLSGEPFIITPRKGALNFIFDYENFKIPEHITVVGVEGHENFREIDRQRYLFEDIHPLFIWRYQNSNALANWLKTLPNKYVHFGDFDPKGLHIYGVEFRDKIGRERCRFLIPENLESSIDKNGEKKLFENQLSFLKLIDTPGYSELENLIEILKKAQKGLAQEFFIV